MGKEANLDEAERIAPQEIKHWQHEIVPEKSEN
jgi:hypothetical protein